MPTLTQIRREGTLDLQGLASELARRKEAVHDVIADTRRVGFHSDVIDDVKQSHVTIDDGMLQAFPLGFRVNDHAHGQLSARLGIPKRYYDRMRSTAPDLLDRNVQAWFTREPETRMFRTLDGNLRAVLSDRYRRLDNFDLMEHVLPVFGDMPDPQFHAAVTDTKMYVRVILQQMQAEIKPGDVVQAGVEITNSEVGAGALGVRPYIWRVLCLNGLVSDAALRRYHVGARQDETSDVEQFLTQETLDMTDRAFFAQVRDVVAGVLNETQFNLIVDLLRESAQSERVQAPVAATRVLAQQFSLDDGEQESLLAHLVEGGDLTRWGVTNAVTALARELDDWDRAAELEAVGGRVVALAGQEWATIARAA